MHTKLFLAQLILLAWVAIPNAYTVDAAETVTVTFYPDPGNTGITTDGRMFEDRYTLWTQTLDTASARITATSENGTDLRNNLGAGGGANYYGNNRPHFGFDTSSLPDDAQIVAATFAVRGGNMDESNGSERRLYLVSSSPASNNTLTTADYSKVGNTSYGVSDNTWTYTGYNLIPLNTAGLDSINKVGVTNYAIRGWYDFNRVTPTDQNELFVHIYFADEPGTDFDPFLEVTYTIETEDPVDEEKGLSELIAELIAAIKGYEFPNAVEWSYLAHLTKLEKLIDNAKNIAAENQVLAFMKKLEQDRAQEVVSEVQYTDLLARANTVLETIGDDAFGAVPLITQRVSPYPSIEETSTWASALFADGRGDAVEGDTCGLTFEECACAITSLTMVGKHHGIDTGFDGTSVNPLTMDAWLITGGEEEGYDAAGNIMWPWGLAYLGEMNDDKYMSHLRIVNAASTDSEEINTFLDTQGPVLGFNRPLGHWTVLTGTIDGGGYSIRDPFYYNTRTTDDVKDAANSVHDYNDVVSKGLLLAYDPVLKPIQEIVQYNLNSPAQLRITDERGRSTGYDPETGLLVHEIPGSSYDSEYAIKNQLNPSENPHRTKELLLVEPEGVYFTLEVIGTGAGTYTLDGAVSDGRGALSGAQVEAETSLHQIDRYTVATRLGTDALPGYLKDILAFIPQKEQKKFIQAFKVVFAQIEKDHMTVTDTLLENLIRYTSMHYSDTDWASSVVAALEELRTE